MNEHLMKTGTNIPRREGDELARLPCLSTWFRTKSAIVLHLSNGTLQINFFQVEDGRDVRRISFNIQDHSKLIVCPLMSAATYINHKKAVFTCKFALLKQFRSIIYIVYSPFLKGVAERRTKIDSPKMLWLCLHSSEY